jgi:hypothetical protein
VFKKEPPERQIITHLWLEIMTNVHFKPLELLTAQHLEFDPKEVLASQAPQYEDVSLNELFDLLEAAIETYTVLSPSLSQRLRESAEQEIEFFYRLTQERLGSMLKQSQFGHLESLVSAA